MLESKREPAFQRVAAARLIPLLAILLLFLPLAAAYNIDQAWVGIVSGGETISANYIARVAVEQGMAGPVFSENYNAKIGWIPTLISDPPTISVQSPVQDENVNSAPTVVFDVNKNSFAEIDLNAITVGLNGTASNDFNSDTNCTRFSGEIHCTYLETGLAKDSDNNIAFNAAYRSGEKAEQVEIIVHYDATAPTIASVSASSTGRSVVVSWVGSDSFTGIEAYYVRVDGGQWIEKGSATSHTFAGHFGASHTYSVKARDFADNNSLISSVQYSPAAEEDTGPGITPGGGGGIPGGIKERDFELEIVRADSPVSAGENLDFTFRVGSNTSTGANAYAEYWLEGGEQEKESEAIYLKGWETKEFDRKLRLPKELLGNYNLYVKLEREGLNPVLASRLVEVVESAPTVIRLDVQPEEPVPGEQTLAFGLFIGSNVDQALPVEIEERLFREGKLVWEKKQEVPVTAYQRFSEEVYDLPPGDYVLEVYARYGNQERFETKNVRIEPKVLEKPGEKVEETGFLLQAAAAVAAIAIASALALYFYRKKKGLFGKDPWES